MTDFFSLSPPRSVYTAIPDGDLSLWQSLTAVNSKQCCYELCTRASVGSDASSVFKAFRNLQALSHSVQGSTLSPSIATHIHTYIQGQPNNMGPSQNQSHCLPSAAHPGSTRKGQHWVQEGKSRNLHPATSCGQAPWQHSDRCSPLVLRAPGRLLTAGTGEGTDPRSEVGVNVRTSSDFCRHPPPHTHTQERLSRKRRLMRVILELTIAAILKYDDNDMNSMGQTFEMATRGYGKQERQWEKLQFCKLSSILNRNLICNQAIVNSPKSPHCVGSVTLGGFLG